MKHHHEYYSASGFKTMADGPGDSANEQKAREVPDSEDRTRPLVLGDTLGWLRFA